MTNWRNLEATAKVLNKLKNLQKKCQNLQDTAKNSFLEQAVSLKYTKTLLICQFFPILIRFLPHLMFPVVTHFLFSGCHREISQPIVGDVLNFANTGLKSWTVYEIRWHARLSSSRLKSCKTYLNLFTVLKKFKTCDEMLVFGLCKFKDPNFRFTSFYLKQSRIAVLKNQNTHVQLWNCTA